MKLTKQDLGPLRPSVEKLNKAIDEVKELGLDCETELWEVLDYIERLAVETRGTVCNTCKGTGCPFPDQRNHCSIHHCPNCTPR